MVSRRVFALSCTLAACSQPATTAPQRMAELRLVSGDGQATIAGYVLPDTIVVSLRDDSGTPIPFATIHASTAALLGQPTLVDALTRADGTARIVWRLGLVLGEQQLVVTTGADALVSPLHASAEARSGRMRTIGGGDDVLCGIDGSGRLGCWRPLADIDHAPQWSPDQTTERFVALAMYRLTTGSWRGCAAAVTGRVWCFDVDQNAVVAGLAELSGNHPAIVSLSTGSGELSSNPPFCGLANDGSAWCWGDNRWGVLGDASLSSRHAVAAVATAARFSQIATSSYHSCATGTDGVGWCWGRNDLSQVGRLPSDDPVTAPVIRTGVLRFTAVVPVAADASCGVARDNGGVYCWGAKISTGIGTLNMQLVDGPSFHLPGFTAGSGRGNSIAAVDRASVLLGSDGESTWWGRLEPGVDHVLAFAPRPFLHQLPLLQVVQSHTSGLLCGTSRDADTHLCGRMMTLTGYPSHQPHLELAGFGMPEQ